MEKPRQPSARRKSKKKAKEDVPSYGSYMDRDNDGKDEFRSAGHCPPPPVSPALPVWGLDVMKLEQLCAEMSRSYMERLDMLEARILGALKSEGGGTGKPISNFPLVHTTSGILQGETGTTLIGLADVSSLGEQTPGSIERSKIFGSDADDSPRSPRKQTFSRLDTISSFDISAGDSGAIFDKKIEAVTKRIAAFSSDTGVNAERWRKMKETQKVNLRHRVVHFLNEAARHKHQQDDTWMKKLVFSTCFKLCSGLLVLCNGVYVGLQTEVELRETFDDVQDTYSFLLFDVLFCVLFTAECAMRYWALGYDQFFFGADRSWNQFDTVNTLMIIGDLLLTAATVNSFVGMSLVRMCRLVRGLRMFRVFRNSSPARYLTTMLHSLKESMGSLGPAMLVIFMTVYMFGIAFMQGIVTAFDDIHKDDGARVLLQEYFGTSGLAFWTLFASVSGGYDWAGVAKPLERIGPLYTAMFLLFIMFTAFCLLNIVTAIFVTCAQHASSLDFEIATDSAMADRKAFEDQLASIFYEIDADGDGLVKLDEFHLLMEDERNATFLGVLGLDLNFVDRFFQVMDTDGNGSLDIIEFVDACVSMKGDAKVLHVRLLQDSINKLTQMVAEIQVALETTADQRVRLLS